MIQKQLIKKLILEAKEQSEFRKKQLGLMLKKEEERKKK